MQYSVEISEGSKQIVLKNLGGIIPAIRHEFWRDLAGSDDKFNENLVLMIITPVGIIVFFILSIFQYFH